MKKERGVRLARTLFVAHGLPRHGIAAGRYAD
jgi:hypothetical protein